jgi:HupE / UreJ protein
MICRLILVAGLFAASLISPPASAHKASDSYLTLNVEGKAITGQWDVALRDLDLALNLDRNADAVIDWGEVRTRHMEIAAYAMQHLEIKQGNGTCALGVTDHLIDEHSDGAYAVMKLKGVCDSVASALTVKYSLLFDVDAQHRGLLKLNSSADIQDGTAKAIGTRSAVFPVGKPVQSFALTKLNAGASASDEFITYVVDGIKHIAIGIDHILFLIALLLPAVLVRSEKKWRPVDDWRAAASSVLKIVTAFTIAHSITLSLAVTDVVQLPSRFVESAIAASVLLTAADNLWPFLPRKRWLVAFSFGLIHGFGFASVLLDLKLPTSALVTSLLGFNIGVELGQLALVVALMPLAYSLRNTQGYSRFALRTGSVAIAAASLGWFVERSLNLQLMPF